MKRTFDLIVSFFALLLFSPLFVLISVVILLTSNGPIFYFSKRVGQNSKVFKLIKFRSMLVNSDNKGSLNVSLNDSRITSFGKFLRFSKLDELPQLINVLIGQMSLVGPRPDIKFYTNMLNETEKKILNLKPGITDWASLVNAFQYREFKNSNDPDKFFLENIRPIKIKLQLYYLLNQSFLHDLEILFWTFIIIFLRVNKVPKKISNLINSNSLN